MLTDEARDFVRDPVFRSQLRLVRELGGEQAVWQGPHPPPVARKSFGVTLSDEYLRPIRMTMSVFQFGVVNCADLIVDRRQPDLNLAASAGVAPNKFLAKIASEGRKPDGLLVIQPDEVDSFMLLQPVSLLPGVGKVRQSISIVLKFRSGCPSLKS
jgi:hypothetical protein